MADDLGHEHELVQPVKSISGVTLYNNVSRKPCGHPVDSAGLPLDYGNKALVIEMDASNNQLRTSERTDGVTCCHLIRQTLEPIVEAPAGYYVMEPATLQHKTRVTVTRDNEGKMVALESGPVSPAGQQTDAAKPRTGFAVADEAS